MGAGRHGLRGAAGGEGRCVCGMDRSRASAALGVRSNNTDGDAHFMDDPTTPSPKPSRHTVETKLCDPGVQSQSGYFKVTGTKDTNCTCTRSVDRKASIRLHSFVYFKPDFQPTRTQRRLLLVLRVPQRPRQRPRHRLAHGRARLLLGKRRVVNM